MAGRMGSKRDILNRGKGGQRNKLPEFLLCLGNRSYSGLVEAENLRRELTHSILVGLS